MSVLLAVAAILLSATLQALATGFWPRSVTFFDLPLIVVLYYGIMKGPTGALMVGLGAGLLQDALGGTLLGVNALSKSIVGYLVGIVGLRFALAPLVSRVLVLAAATVLSRFIEVGTLAIMGRKLAYAPYPHLVGTVLGNCLIGSIVIGVFRPESDE